MKINIQLIFFYSATVNLAASTCSTNDIAKPEHWDGWSCKSRNGSLTQGPWDRYADVGTKCDLQCLEGFLPWAGQKRKHYRCGNDGDWHPDQLDLQCKYDRKFIIISEFKFNHTFKRSFGLRSWMVR